MTGKPDDPRQTGPEGDFARRTFLGGAALTVAAAALLPATAEGAADEPPERLLAQPSDRLMISSGGKLEGKLLRPEMLTLGAAPLTAFPFDAESNILRRKNRLNRLLVLRLDTQAMDDDTRAHAAAGVLAYSALCTHKACTIKSWRARKQHLRCHCHLSEFAPLRMGKVIKGPARTDLPLLRLALAEDGVLQVAEGFNRRPGAKTK